MKEWRRKEMNESRFAVVPAQQWLFLLRCCGRVCRNCRVERRGLRDEKQEAINLLRDMDLCAITNNEWCCVVDVL
jgi:hypothetical protein